MLLFRERFSVAVPPGLPDPGERLNAALCPNPTRHITKIRIAKRSNSARSVAHGIIDKVLPPTGVHFIPIRLTALDETQAGPDRHGARMNHTQ